ncbi:putative rRNA-processing protein fcf2 [Dipodascopsis uninucleata]
MKTRSKRAQSSSDDVMGESVNTTLNAESNDTRNELNLREDSFMRLDGSFTSEANGYEEKFFKQLPKLDPGISFDRYLTRTSGVVRLNAMALLDSSNHNDELKLREVVDLKKVKMQMLEAKEATTGGKWFDMPKAELTPEVKRDLQILKMRNVLDPKRHYKKDGDVKSFPKYFQTGTIIEGPTEFYSARLTKKERKQTLADEILADTKSKQYFKRKYTEIQNTKVSGGKNFYKGIKRKRSRR